MGGHRGLLGAGVAWGGVPCRWAPPSGTTPKPAAPPRAAARGQAPGSIAGGEPGSGRPADSVMRQTAKPPTTAAAIM
ncbi:hypothetical protein GCM10010245_25690 [Streptomyces spectabilis]|nr:hypothetical protein GCM10010245_25690 [Streptomyces spectabilis]